MVRSLRAFALAALGLPLRLARDRRAVSAVEFAIVLPVMLTLYVGGNEVSHALTIARKVTHVTSALGDLVAQCTTVTSSDMTNIMAAAASVMSPYSPSLLKIKLTGINVDANSTATLAWAAAYQDTALTTVPTLPTAIKIPSTFIVLAEVHYAYTPGFGYVLTGTYDLHDKFYFNPRTGGSIAYPSTTACSAT